jgi:hypothetical protein
MILTKSSFKIIGVVSLLTLTVLWLRVFPMQRAEAATNLNKTYTNAAWGFSLQMPADFSAYPPNASPDHDETGAPIGQAVVLQNTAGAAVQFEITQDNRARSGNTLTVDDVAEEEPYMDLSEAQPIQIAPGVTGVSFTFEDPSPSRTVRDDISFVYRGNYYEVNADAKDRAVLRSMMSSLTFL